MKNSLVSCVSFLTQIVEMMRSGKCSRQVETHSAFHESAFRPIFKRYLSFYSILFLFTEILGCKLNVTPLSACHFKIINRFGLLLLSLSLKCKTTSYYWKLEGRGKRVAFDEAVSQGWSPCGLNETHGLLWDIPQRAYLHCGAVACGSVELKWGFYLVPSPLL